MYQSYLFELVYSFVLQPTNVVGQNGLNCIILIFAAFSNTILLCPFCFPQMYAAWSLTKTFNNVKVEYFSATDLDLLKSLIKTRFFSLIGKEMSVLHYILAS